MDAETLKAGFLSFLGLQPATQTTQQPPQQQQTQQPPTQTTTHPPATQTTQTQQPPQQQQTQQPPTQTTTQPPATQTTQTQQPPQQQQQPINTTDGLPITTVADLPPRDAGNFLGKSFGELMTSGGGMSPVGAAKAALRETASNYPTFTLDAALK